MKNVKRKTVVGIVIGALIASSSAIVMFIVILINTSGTVDGSLWVFLVYVLFMLALATYGGLMGYIITQIKYLPDKDSSS